MATKATRTERDTMGELEVPREALWGAQTARAVVNFPISGRGIGREMIQALGLIKQTAARVNRELGLLEPRIAEVIERAALEVARGELDDHFPVDVFQTGSGTSSNMNANEVVANRAIQLLGGTLGSKAVHPNDHVNLGQSSNDVFPSALHVAGILALEEQMVPALERLARALTRKQAEFGDVIKTGRTHLQDATPITLGQEFSGYASQIEHGLAHLRGAALHLRELALGGTAVGTGINTHPEFGTRMAAALSSLTGHDFVEAKNHFEAQAAQDAAVAVSGALRTLAVSLTKIANDIRWLGSGPRLGLGELLLPEVQPGSSIMPGKVNPVIAEALIMVAAQVIGNDASIALGGLGGLGGAFELNTMLPLIARNLVESINLLARAADVFRERLLEGLRADRTRIADQNERSLMLATPLAPILGYDRAAEIAKTAHASGRTIREVVLEQGLIAQSELDRALDLSRLVKPGND